MRKFERHFGNRCLAGLIVLLLMAGNLQAQTRLDEFSPEGKDPWLNASPFKAQLRASPAYTGTQPFDVIHYRLDVNLAMTTESFQGTSSIILMLTSPADSIVLNEVSLQLDTVRVDGTQKSIAIYPSTETFAIRLGGTRNAGDTLHISIAYRRLPETSRPNSRLGYYYFSAATLSGLPANLGYTMSEPSDARFWMPCYDEPWDKATAEINATVPAGYVAASNGVLLGVDNNLDGTVTWRWKEDHQIATYLMCVTASQFTIPSLNYESGDGRTIPIQYYTWKTFTEPPPPNGRGVVQDSANAAAYLPTVRNMVDAFSHLFGEYPFDKYGMSSVVPFSYGGMEHQTLTTLNRYYITDGRVVPHELAHQWWGDLVTCGTWKDIWLNESFATYSEALWNESIGDFPALKSYMTSLLHLNFGSWQGAVYDPQGQGFNLFDDVVYSKGAWVLHTLRGVLGDSLFFRSLRAYRQKFTGRSAITDEFRGVIDSVAGQDMRWFFNEWIYGPGWPVYAYAYTWPGDSLSLRIYQQQSSSWPTYKMPIQIRILHGTDRLNTVVWDSLRIQTFKIPLAFSPDSVALDPDAWIMKQIVPSTVSAGEATVPLATALNQNYPNPFNPTTVVSYQVSGVSYVRLVVYDLLGREVATLVDGRQEAGRRAVPFDGSGLASGIYFYRLAVQPLGEGGHQSFVSTRKMIFMR